MPKSHKIKGLFVAVVVVVVFVGINILYINTKKQEKPKTTRSSFPAVLFFDLLPFLHS